MKSIATLALTCLGLLLNFSCLEAAPSVGVDQVQLKDGKVLVQRNGVSTPASDKVELPFDIVVLTNATYTVKGGKARTLHEREILRPDGTLTKPDGSTMTVLDVVTMNRGHVLVFKDGASSELGAVLKLADGSTVTPAGDFTPAGGSPRRLLDGEIIRLEGGALPARDSITLLKGRVQVQKDGSTLTVNSRSSIMMNDGTKVLGDGTVIKPNGERTTLHEGEIILLEGVVRKK